MPASLSPTALVLLVLVSLIGGVGITAIGPGGVLVTIALVAFTDLSPAEVAGTAIVTHIGTGIAGSLAFLRSGQLRGVRTRRLAWVLSVAAIVGVPVGALVNARLSDRQFGVILAIFVTFVGITVVLRELYGSGQRAQNADGLGAVLPQTVLGGGVAVIGGIFGVGGPILSVPIMVIVGYPMLAALAAAQVHSVAIAGMGTVSYVAQGSVSWPLVIVTGVPQIIGVWLGWRIAHAVPTRPLKFLLAASLVVLGPMLLITG